jgi:glycosyltransferase involved in cell wall biosynthesis
LNGYFSRAAFLLLPSRADCTPIVCHEATAFGLPVLATDVGGLPSTVDSGQTGMLWSPEKFSAEAPPWIAATLAERPRYEALARAARRRFETRGNWAVNVRAIAAAIAAEKPKP